MSAYRPQSRDTAPDVERVLIERLRCLSSVEKARQISQLHRAAQELTLAGLRKRYPEASPHELYLRAGALRIDAELMRKAFGWNVSEKGL